MNKQPECVLPNSFLSFITASFSTSNSYNSNNNKRGDTFKLFLSVMNPAVVLCYLNVLYILCRCDKQFIKLIYEFIAQSVFIFINIQIFTVAFSTNNSVE